MADNQNTTSSNINHPGAATLTASEEPVTAIASDGSERLLQVGDFAMPGDTLLTGDSPIAILTFSDGARKGILANSTFQIEDPTAADLQNSEQKTAGEQPTPNPVQGSEDSGVPAQQLEAAPIQKAVDSVEDIAQLPPSAAGPEAATDVSGGVDDSVPVASNDAGVEPSSSVPGMMPKAVPMDLIGESGSATVITLREHNVRIQVDQILNEDAGQLEVRNFDLETDRLVLEDLLIEEGWNPDSGNAALSNFMRVVADDGDTLIQVGRWVDGTFIVEHVIRLDGINLSEFMIARGAVDRVPSVDFQDQNAAPVQVGNSGAMTSLESEGAESAVWLGHADPLRQPEADAASSGRGGVQTQQPKARDTAESEQDMRMLREGRFEEDVVTPRGDDQISKQDADQGDTGDASLSGSSINLLDSIIILLQNTTSSLLDSAVVDNTVAGAEQLATDLLSVLAQENDPSVILQNLESLLVDPDTGLLTDSAGGLPSDLQNLLGVIVGGTATNDESVLENLGVLLSDTGTALTAGEEATIAETLDVVTALVDGLSNADPSALPATVDALGDVIASLGGVVSAVNNASSDSDDTETTGGDDADVLTATATLAATAVQAASGTVDPSSEETLLSTEAIAEIVLQTLDLVETGENTTSDALTNLESVPGGVDAVLDAFSNGDSETALNLLAEALFADVGGTVTGGDGSATNNLGVES